MLLPELCPGEVVPEHFLMEFPGENDRVTVGPPELLWLHNYVGTRNSQGVCFVGKGSTQRKTGVPPSPAKQGQPMNKGSSPLRGAPPNPKHIAL